MSTTYGIFTVVGDADPIVYSTGRKAKAIRLVCPNGHERVLAANNAKYGNGTKTCKACGEAVLESVAALSTLRPRTFDTFELPDKPSRKDSKLKCRFPKTLRDMRQLSRASVAALSTLQVRTFDAIGHLEVSGYCGRASTPRFEPSHKRGLSGSFLMTKSAVKSIAASEDICPVTFLASWHDLRHVYRHMVFRCHDPKSNTYECYSKAGRTVCPEWLGSEGRLNFTLDMGPRRPGETLERVDNNDGYSPNNCRWANQIEQSNNTCLSHLYKTPEGLKTLAQLSYRSGYSIGQLQNPYTEYAG